MCARVVRADLSLQLRYLRTTRAETTYKFRWWVTPADSTFERASRAAARLGPTHWSNRSHGPRPATVSAPVIRWCAVSEASQPTDVVAPFDEFRAVVLPEWIDHNGHMNMGFYLVVFDLATDAWFRHLGLDEAHRAAHRVTTFCLEAHVTYHREVREADPLRFTTRLLGWDAKRIHFFHEMFHAEAGFLAATNELMSLHVSEATRRGAPMAGEIRDRLARVQAIHGGLPPAPQIGRRMGLTVAPTTRPAS